MCLKYIFYSLLIFITYANNTNNIKVCPKNSIFFIWENLMEQGTTIPIELSRLDKFLG